MSGFSLARQTLRNNETLRRLDPSSIPCFGFLLHWTSKPSRRLAATETVASEQHDGEDQSLEASGTSFEAGPSTLPMLADGHMQSTSRLRGRRPTALRATSTAGRSSGSSPALLSGPVFSPRPGPPMRSRHILRTTSPAGSFPTVRPSIIDDIPRSPFLSTPRRPAPTPAMSELLYELMALPDRPSPTELYRLLRHRPNLSTIDMIHPILRYAKRTSHRKVAKELEESMQLSSPSRQDHVSGRRSLDQRKYHKPRLRDPFPRLGTWPYTIPKWLLRRWHPLLAPSAPSFHSRLPVTRTLQYIHRRLLVDPLSLTEACRQVKQACEYEGQDTDRTRGALKDLMHLLMVYAGSLCQTGVQVMEQMARRGVEPDRQTLHILAQSILWTKSRQELYRIARHVASSTLSTETAVAHQESLGRPSRLRLIRQTILDLILLFWTKYNITPAPETYRHILLCALDNDYQPLGRIAWDGWPLANMRQKLNVTSDSLDKWQIYPRNGTRNMSWAKLVYRAMTESWIERVGSEGRLSWIDPVERLELLRHTAKELLFQFDDLDQEVETARTKSIPHSGVSQDQLETMLVRLDPQLDVTPTVKVPDDRE